MCQSSDFAKTAPKPWFFHHFQEGCMKKRLMFGLAGAFLAALLLWGCQSSTEPVEDKYTVFQELIDGDALFTSDASVLAGDQDVPSSSLMKTSAPIIPLVWGRQVTSASRSVTFQEQADTIVIATITTTISGNVKIAALDSLRDTTITIVSKPFTETLTRKVKFYKIANTNRIRDNWRMREVSALKGGTTNSLITIDQLQAIIGTDTLTVTDPNEFYLKFSGFAGRQLPSLGMTTPVKVRITITSTESDTDFVMLHRPATLRPVHKRTTLVSQTGAGPYTRVYEFTWNSHIKGRHHFYVSAVTRNSLFDDVAPWATQLWGFPYLVL